MNTFHQHLLIGFLSLVLVSACSHGQGAGTAPAGVAGQKTNSADQGATSSGGDPSSCTSTCQTANAGMLLVNQAGVSTLCQFSFAEISEYSLCQALAKGPQSVQATNAFMHSTNGAQSYPNATTSDADQYCQSVGGQIQVEAVTYRPNSTLSLCVFPDSSQIEEWTLFWGVNTGFSSDLAQVLSSCEKRLQDQAKH